MSDRLLSFGLNFTIVSMIAGLTAVSLALGYWGLLHLLAVRLESGAVEVATGLGLAMASWTLVRHRNDLVDR